MKATALRLLREDDVQRRRAGYDENAAFPDRWALGPIADEPRPLRAVSRRSASCG